MALAQRVCVHGGIGSGSSAISAVTGQTEELERIVNYVREAWTEVQNMHQNSGLYWRWMRIGFTLTTVSGTGEYAFGSSAIVDDETATQIARFRKWLINDDCDPPKIYLQSAGVGGEGYLSYLHWDDFKSIYRLGTQNNSFPHHISVNPLNEIALGPIPDDVYIVTGDFLRGAQVLAADGDTPDMPSDYHDLIVYKALLKYGLYESAPEVIAAAEYGISQYMDRLVGDQLSQIPLADTLA